MTWATAYLGCFVLGLTFVVLSSLVGKFGGGDADASGDAGGHDVGTGDAGQGDAAHGDGDGGGKVGLPLFSPTVLAVFVGMFGAGGLLLHRVLGIDAPLLHAGGAAGISGVSGLSVAWTMMKLLIHAETNAMASHRELVGMQVEVTASIRGEQLGQISYTAGGTYQTIVARGDGGASFAQGEKVLVLEITDGTARVGPLGARPPEPVAAIDSKAIGVPVPKERTK